MNFIKRWVRELIMTYLDLSKLVEVSIINKISNDDIIVLNFNRELSEFDFNNIMKLFSDSEINNKIIITTKGEILVISKKEIHQISDETIKLIINDYLVNKSSYDLSLYMHDMNTRVTNTDFFNELTPSPPRPLPEIVIKRAEELGIKI